jgi:hypothetical protein
MCVRLPHSPMLTVVYDRAAASGDAFVLRQFRPAYGAAAFLALTGAPHKVVNERSAVFSSTGALPAVTSGSLVLPACALADRLAEVRVQHHVAMRALVLGCACLNRIASQCVGGGTARTHARTDSHAVRLLQLLPAMDAHLTPGERGVARAVRGMITTQLEDALVRMGLVSWCCHVAVTRTLLLLLMLLL